MLEVATKHRRSVLGGRRGQGRPSAQHYLQGLPRTLDRKKGAHDVVEPFSVLSHVEQAQAPSPAAHEVSRHHQG